MQPSTDRQAHYFCDDCPDHEACSQGACGSAAVEALKEQLKEQDGTRTCTSWHDSCHGDPEIDECLCEVRRREARLTF